MAESRRNYSKEFKQDAVRLLERGTKTGREISEDLGIGQGAIYRWRRQMEEEHEAGIRAFPGKGNPRDEELARLRKELAEVREERDILRKAVAIFSKTKR
jgi:transposase